MSTIATLDGVPLLADDAVGWKFTQGVQPYQRAFTMDRDGANELLRLTASGRPVTLRIDFGDRQALVVKKLYVLGVLPARAPYLVSVLVGDGRVWWSRKHVAVRMNVRRRSGEMKQAEQGGVLVPIEKLGGVPDVQYARYSLRNRKERWIPKTAVEFVAGRVTDGFRLDDVNLDGAGALTVEGIELDDPGDGAMQRIMQLVPNLTCWLDGEGMTRFTITSDADADGQQIAGADYPIVGPSLVEKVDMSRSRPSAIEVYFTPQDELRFDFSDPDTATRDADRPPRILENVLPSPDPFINVRDSQTGATRRIVQGTWLPIDDALFNAWQADSAHPATINFRGKTINLPPLTAALVRKLWFVPGGYHLYYECALQTDPVWARRWSALMHHYRQTFRVKREWVDLIYQFKDERVALLDSVNGIMAPADVFANYAMIPTARRVALGAGDSTKQVAWNVTNFTAGAALASSKVANTATLDIVDQDQGIVRVSYNPDAWGGTMKIVPSAVVSKHDNNAIPTFDPRDMLKGFMLRDLKLKDEHALAIVLSAVPAAPNGLEGLHKVVVGVEDAKTVLPAAVARQVGKCVGPVWQARVGAGIMKARFAWTDGAASEVESAYFNGTPRSSSRLVDPEQVETMAKAVAASIYGALADHLEGMHVTAMDPNALPVGRISAVSHILARTGAGTTSMELAPSLKPLDPFALLPESMRRIILRQVK